MQTTISCAGGARIIALHATCAYAPTQQPHAGGKTLSRDPRLQCSAPSSCAGHAVWLPGLKCSTRGALSTSALSQPGPSQSHGAHTPQQGLSEAMPPANAVRPVPPHPESDDNTHPKEPWLLCEARTHTMRCESGPVPRPRNLYATQPSAFPCGCAISASPEAGGHLCAQEARLAELQVAQHARHDLRVGQRQQRARAVEVRRDHRAGRARVLVLHVYH